MPSVPDPFCWYPALMKQCVICGDPVVSKRKDAKYCQKPVCRKKAYQHRQEETKKAQPQLRAHKAQVVVAFPDGSRWLLELTPLRAAAEANLPSLTQIPDSSEAIGSGSVLPESPAPLTAISPASPPTAAPEIRSEPIPQASAPAPPAQPVAPIVRNELRTVELYFVDETNRRLPFRDAVLERGRGDWRVRRHARALLGFHRSEGHGLGGMPGRWREYYLRRSPSEFGLDGDLGVLYADEEAKQVYAAEASLLRESLGIEWRERLQRFCAEWTRPNRM